MFELNAHAHPKAHFLRSDIDQPGREPKPLLLDQLDDRQHIGNLLTGKPLMTIDGESMDESTAAHRLGRDFGTEAFGAAPKRRMNPVSAGFTSGNEQFAAFSSGPERDVLEV